MKRAKTGLALMFLGAALILGALALILSNRHEDIEAGTAAHVLLTQVREQMPEAEQPAAAENLSVHFGAGEQDARAEPMREMPAVDVDGYSYIGTLEIPALGLSLPVMSQWSYPGLKIAPGRYAGSVYDGSLIVAGHNYKSHFGWLNTLVPGDEVTFTDVDGNVYAYAVSYTEIVEPHDLARMEAGEWELTLFTCTVGGKQRVAVRCVETDVSQN